MECELVLGIESSCDETAAAVVDRGRSVLSNVVASQIDIHRPYGGVVPELASRSHVEAIVTVIDRALEGAGRGLEGVDAVAVTRGPGLVGCLMVGVAAAKSIALACDLPIVGVDHLEAHVAAIYLEHDPGFPFVALVASGGHTCLYYARGRTEFELIGKTRDDAAGEAFDKGAKLLGLGYPGGVEIDRLAREGDPEAVAFPRAFVGKGSHDFSFSGLKTALAYYVKRHGVPRGKGLADLCASYQEAIVDTLVEKTLIAAHEKGVERVVMTGGVACNSRLRRKAASALEAEGMELLIPSPTYCTDNAAMVASLGYFMLREGKRSDLGFAPYSTSRPRYVRGRGLLAP